MPFSEEHLQTPRRLGKRELGPHAFEECMPERVWDLISREDVSSMQQKGVIAQLVRLLQNDRGVASAYLCTEQAVQISKSTGEGAHFCGYRNIQMLLLALQKLNYGLSAKIPQDLRIPNLQKMIEHAWDTGVNDHGKVMIGRLFRTRKHIGSPEAEALLLSIGIPCTGHAFHETDAWIKLLDAVELYFRPHAINDAPIGVYVANRAPIFLQRPRHSITIIGIERLHSGKRRLLAFDPQWQPPSAMRKPLEDDERKGWSAQMLLWRYRKSLRYVKRYQDFEMLTVDDIP